MKKRMLCLLLTAVLCLSLLACGKQEETPTDNTQSAQDMAEPTESATQSEPTEQSEHVYDNDCDEDCNECGELRVVADHSYENACDGECDICGEKREVSEHEYDSECATRCNTCGTKRTTNHGKSNDQVGYCTICGQYTGQTGDANFRFTMEFDGSDMAYFRVAGSAGMKQSIQFAGTETFVYTAYVSVDGAYQQVELTETAQEFAASEYLYLVITPPDGVTDVTFQITETE